MSRTPLDSSTALCAAARQSPDLPTNTMAAAERWAAGSSGPAYAIDDETAIKGVDATIEVVSERHWKLFNRSAVLAELGH